MVCPRLLDDVFVLKYILGLCFLIMFYFLCFMAFCLVYFGWKRSWTRDGRVCLAWVNSLKDNGPFNWVRCDRRVRLAYINLLKECCRQICLTWVKLLKDRDKRVRLV